jgi:hypothetical protein
MLVFLVKTPDRRWATVIPPPSTEIFRRSPWFCFWREKSFSPFLGKFHPPPTAIFSFGDARLLNSVWRRAPLNGLRNPYFFHFRGGASWPHQGPKLGVWCPRPPPFPPSETRERSIKKGPKTQAVGQRACATKSNKIQQKNPCLPWVSEAASQSRKKRRDVHQKSLTTIRAD